MKNLIAEADVEENVLDILRGLGYDIVKGAKEEYLPKGSRQLRSSYEDVILEDKLKGALERINPDFSEQEIEAGVRRVKEDENKGLIEENKEFHKMLIEGVPIQVKRGGERKYARLMLFDFDNPENNDFMAVNQFRIEGHSCNRKPDVILFVNGLPLVVLELKNPVDKGTDIWDAYNQFQTYKQDIPYLFKYNGILVISDGVEARVGTITSPQERFSGWKTIDGKEPKESFTEIEVLLRGMCNKFTLMDILRNFIIFENGKEVEKKVASYHQYSAVNKAIESTRRASYILQTKESPEKYGQESVEGQPKGDKKAGVVWHTQGSGKSLTMLFYSGKLVKEFNNPTIVVLTDRNDLDDQLFQTFVRCKDILRQDPKQANTRRELQELLSVVSGGVVFTTIQKFYPERGEENYPVLSDRDNIIVIADEAHRSQYGFSANVSDKTTYGYATHLRNALPNASFIGFTGTPIEKEDKSTPAVFGSYVDVYDIQQAVDDGATVKILYESRLADVGLKPEEVPKIDKEFEEVTESEEISGKEKLKSKWSRMEKIVGSKERIDRIAKDIVKHFDERLKYIEGKGMIVGTSRRICVDLYNAIVKIKPEWEDKDDGRGYVKVVMTGSASDPKEWQQHIRDKGKRKKIGDNFKDPNHPLKLMIVRDMFLTGFDAPSLHTMYLDKLVKGHTLMQTIARVNRVWGNKQGGLIVDYIGIGTELKRALMNYTKSGGKGKPTLDQEEAVNVMMEKYGVVRDMFYGFDYVKFFKLESKERINFIRSAIEHILKEKGKKERFMKEVTALLKAFSLSVPKKEAMDIRDEVGLFQAIKSSITKASETKKTSQEKFDSAINQILSKAVVSDRVVDIFEAVGMEGKPDLSILSEDFLAEVKNIPHKNLAFEMLKKLLRDEIRTNFGKNVVKENSFMDLLTRTINKYRNRTIEAAQVIEELVEIAREIKKEKKRGEKLNLREDEIAFYDSLEVNDSAVKIMGDKALREIALELTEAIKKSVTIDWMMKQSVRAQIRLKVKKILKRHGYPPDKQEEAVKRVLKQAEVIADDLANSSD